MFNCMIYDHIISLPSVIGTRTYQSFLMVSFLFLAKFLLRDLCIGLQVPHKIKADETTGKSSGDDFCIFFFVWEHKMYIHIGSNDEVYSTSNGKLSSAICPLHSVILVGEA